jgi:hypothetical protein
VVDVLFDRPGEISLQHRTPDRTYPLGRIVVRDEEADTPAAKGFHALRRAPEFKAERARIAADLEREPDKVLALVAEMSMEGGHAAPSDPTTPGFAYPMDPEVVSVGQDPRGGPLPGARA